MDLNQLTADHEILMLSVLLLSGVFLSKLASRLGVPSLVIFIGIGMILGSDITGLIYFDDAYLARLIGVIALIIILFEGGLRTDWPTIRPVLPPAGALATVGVVLTAGIVGVLAHYILGVSLLEGLLFGAIVGSTDAAAVFAVLGTKRIRQKIATTLEAESGLNDPMAIFLTIAFIQTISLGHGNFDGSAFLFLFVLQIGLGILIGLVMGRLAVFTVNRLLLEGSALYPILAMAFAISTYSAAQNLQGSGFLAVYILGLVMGNSRLAHRHSIVRFHEGMAWLMQIVMFMILGLLVFPREMIASIGPGLLLAGALMLVARPLAVWVTLLPFGFSWRSKLFISWSGLRGAVPIILATYPFIAGLPNSALFFNSVFFVVFTSALIQGATIERLAKYLKLYVPGNRQATPTLELLNVGSSHADLLEIDVVEDSPAIGQKLARLPLPEKVTVSALVRDNEIIAPRGNTRIRVGDVLFILCGVELEDEVKSVFWPLDIAESEDEPSA